MFNIEPKEPVTVAFCCKCKGDIYLDEVYGEDREGKAICSDCIKDLWNELNITEQFEVFGYCPTRQELAVRKVHRIW